MTKIHFYLGFKWISSWHITSWITLLMNKTVFGHQVWIINHSKCASGRCWFTIVWYKSGMYECWMKQIWQIFDINICLDRVAVYVNKWEGLLKFSQKTAGWKLKLLLALTNPLTMISLLIFPANELVLVLCFTNKSFLLTQTYNYCMPFVPLNTSCAHSNYKHLWHYNVSAESLTDSICLFPVTSSKMSLHSN